MADKRTDEHDYQGDGGYEGGREAVFGQAEHSAAPARRGGTPPTGWQDPHYGGVSPAMRRGGGYGHGRFQRTGRR